MKTLICISIMALMGCATVNCPPEDMVLVSPWTGMPVVVGKGSFNDMDKCVTSEQFKKRMEEWNQQEQKNKLDKYLEEGREKI